MFNTLANRVISNDLYNNDKRYIANERREYRSGFIGGLSGRSGDSDGMTYAKDGKFITPPTDKFGVAFKEADIGGGVYKGGSIGGSIRYVSKPEVHHDKEIVEDKKLDKLEGKGLGDVGGSKKKGRPKGSKNKKGNGMSGGGVGKPPGYSGGDVDIDPVKYEGGVVHYPAIKTGPNQKVTQSYNDGGELPKPKPAGFTVGKGISGGKKKGRPKGSKNKKKGGAENLAEVREGGSKDSKVWEVVEKALGKGISGGNTYMNDQAKQDEQRGAGLAGGIRRSNPNLTKVMAIKKRDKCSLKEAWKLYKAL